MPKLKGGEMKVPPFISDLYADLRDRRLLPLVALILLAIVATPILLSGSEEPEALPLPGPTAGGSAPASKSLTVVKAEPGLRNYKERLAHRRPANPFKQRFAGPRGLKEAQLNVAPTPSTTESSSTTTETSKNSESESPVTVPSGGSGTGGGSNNDEIPKGATFYSLAVTVQITRIETKPDGTVDKKGPTLYKDIQAPAPLPGEKTPVLTYLGMGSKDREPLFLVSTDVTAIFGEAKCITGTGSCQLMSLEEGFPVTFVYGDNDVRYKIDLVKAEPVVTGKS
jgi:hypothetical protein